MKRFEKVEKFKKFANVSPLYDGKVEISGQCDILVLADVPPTRNDNFLDFSKNEMLWWQKMGKVVNRVKLTIPSQSQPHFGGKDRKTCKMTRCGCFDPI